MGECWLCWLGSMLSRLDANVGGIGCVKLSKGFDFQMSGKNKELVNLIGSPEILSSELQSYWSILLLLNLRWMSGHGFLSLSFIWVLESVSYSSKDEKIIVIQKTDWWIWGINNGIITIQICGNCPIEVFFVTQTFCFCLNYPHLTQIWLLLWHLDIGPREETSKH